MNLNSRATRMLAGAIVGVQMESRVRGVVPAQFAGSSDMILLAAMAVYLMWTGRPQAGGLGDFLDGVAIGIAGVTATRVIPLPV